MAWRGADIERTAGAERTWSGQRPAPALAGTEAVPGFARIGAAEGFQRLQLRRAPFPLAPVTAPAVFILEAEGGARVCRK